MGGQLGSYISRVFGRGDYTIAPGTEAIKTNSLVRGGPPAFGSENVKIRHREFVGDVITSSTAGAFNY